MGGQRCFKRFERLMSGRWQGRHAQAAGTKVNAPPIGVAGVETDDECVFTRTQALRVEGEARLEAFGARCQRDRPGTGDKRFQPPARTLGDRRCGQDEFHSFRCRTGGKHKGDAQFAGVRIQTVPGHAAIDDA